MKYSLKRVWWQLKYHWKIYLFILLEYVVGSFVLVSCMNIFYSSKETLADLKKEMVDGTIPISCTGGSDITEETKFPITYETYLELSLKYSNDFNMLFAQYCSLTYLIQQKMINLNVIFMNNNMFEDLFGYEQKKIPSI